VGGVGGWFWGVGGVHSLEGVLGGFLGFFRKSWFLHIYAYNRIGGMGGGWGGWGTPPGGGKSESSFFRKN